MGAVRQIATALFAASLVAGGVRGASAAECAPPPAQAVRLANSGVVLHYSIPDGPVRVGKPFTLLLSACSAAGRPLPVVRADAWMPAHGHGMNYRPTARRTESGLRRYEGFLLHMPGTWEVRVDVAAKDGRARFRIPLVVSR